MTKKKATQYYIHNGVRRALVARHHGLKTIQALIYEERKLPVPKRVRLSQLHSPKRSILADIRLFRIMPPFTTRIEIELLGLDGQLPTVPLSKVKIV